MRPAAAALAAAVLASAACTATAQGDSTTGTWSIYTTASSSDVQLSLAYRNDHGSDEESRPVPFDPAKFVGLTRTMLRSNEQDVRFTIVRDAGSFDCAGAFRDGTGSGVFTFVKSDAFVNALAARGIGSMSDQDQLDLAMVDMSLSTVELLVSNRISVSSHDLVRLADHGVGGDFVSGLLHDGYHPSADDLMRLADHGVTLDFIAKLKAHGYSPSIDDLIRLRDAGM